MINRLDEYSRETMHETGIWLVSFDAIAALSSVVKDAHIAHFAKGCDEMALSIVRSAAANDFRTVHGRLRDGQLNVEQPIREVAKKMDVLDSKNKLRKPVELALLYRYDTELRSLVQEHFPTVANTHRTYTAQFASYFANEASRTLESSGSRTELSAFLGKICLETSLELS